jgi:hypothetical protein
MVRLLLSALVRTAEKWVLMRPVLENFVPLYDMPRLRSAAWSRPYDKRHAMTGSVESDSLFVIGVTCFLALLFFSWLLFD